MPNDHFTTKFKGTILLGTPYEQDKLFRNPAITVTVFTSDSIAAQLTGNQSWHSAERSTHMQCTFLYTTFSQVTEMSMDKMRNSVTLEGLPGGRVEGPRFLLSLFDSKTALCSLVPPFFPLFVPCLIYLPTTFPHHQHRPGGSVVPIRSLKQVHVLFDIFHLFRSFPTALGDPHPGRLPFVRTVGPIDQYANLTRQFLLYRARGF